MTNPPGLTTVTCANCGTLITGDYYVVNGAPVCATCKDLAATTFATGSQTGRFPKAMMLGLLGAIAGAILYYAVIALANIEIGIVAILCGYMVGWAVRRGSGGLGGRRYQVLAAALTYFSVGLAYAPFGFRAVLEGESVRKLATHTAAMSPEDSAAVADSIRAAVADSMRAAVIADSLITDSLMMAENAAQGDSSGVTAAATQPPSPPIRTQATPRRATKGDDSRPSVPAALAMLFGFLWLLPILMVIGSLPSGLISAFIIVLGMRQAWRMATGTRFNVAGPFRVGGGR